MKQEVKLVLGQTLEGQKLEFMIYNKSLVGKGAFGVVKKAFLNSRPEQQLVVKIIPFNDDKKRQKINKELKIIRSLPDHQNIVKVLPMKCFSENNFYIFMEYCMQGTLQMQIRRKGHFTQHEIFNIFFQLVSGYKVLWEKKILHQDLKPDNILIKNGQYKLTDFGFSIFHQGVQFDRQRQGTLVYMPLEKLIQKKYFANTKSDVYSMGVIMFKIIARRHPYVLTRTQNDKDYIKKLEQNNLQIPINCRTKMSIQMQHLFDMVIKMIAKYEKNRIDFAQIFSFIEKQQGFEQFRLKKQQIKTQHSQQILLPQKKILSIVQTSSAFVLKFPQLQNLQNQQQFQKQKLFHLKQQKLQLMSQSNEKIQKYLISMRLIVYFFDRLNRRLHVQNLKNSTDKIDLYEFSLSEKVILSLIYLEKKINAETLQETIKNNLFSKDEWNQYKKTDGQILRLIKMDKKHIEKILQLSLIQTRQSKIYQRKQIIESSKLSLFEFMQSIRLHLLELLQIKKTLFSLQGKQSLTTFIYILSAFSIIDNFQQWIQKYQEIQTYFRQIQTQQDENIMVFKIIEGLLAIGQDFSLDITQIQQQGQINNA